MRNTIATALAVACLMLAGCGEQPTHQGKTFKEWDRASRDTDYKTRQEAYEAIFQLARPHDAPKKYRDRLCEILPSYKYPWYISQSVCGIADRHWERFHGDKPKPFYIDRTDPKDLKALYPHEAEKLAKP